VVIYPLLLGSIYFIFFAKDRYISTSQVSVQDAASAAGNTSINIGLLSGLGGSNANDALFLQEYIKSSMMLEQIDKAIGFQQAFANNDGDLFYGLPFNYQLPGNFGLPGDYENRWLRWLPWRFTKESLLRYYQNRITVTFNDSSNLLYIETQGFTPEFALKFNLAILKESEKFINELSHKIIREQMSFAENELRKAYEKLTKSKEAVLKYQSKHGFLDPVVQAETSNRMVMEMEAQKARAETELRNQLTYLKENTPQIISSRNALAALNKQIELERAKIAAPTPGTQLNNLAAQFMSLKAQLEFDASVYDAARATTEKMRIESLRQLKVLSIVVAPQLAEEAAYPRMFYILTSLTLGLFLLYGSLRLIFSIIEEHRD